VTAQQIVAADALPLALATALFFNMLLVAAIFCTKAARERRERRAEIVRNHVIEEVVSLIDGERETIFLPAPYHADAPAALDAVIRVIATLKGDAQHLLVQLLERSKYIEKLVRDSRSRDAVRRCECAMLLGAAHSTEGTAALCDLLENDRASDVRMIAAEALGSIGDPASIPLIMKALADPTRFQQLRIAGVLVAFGTVAVPSLERALDDPGDLPLALLLDALSDIGLIGEPRRALALLLHTSPEIRGRAATLLGAAQIVDSVAELALASRDVFWFVRLRIAKALGALGIPDREPAYTIYFSTLERLLQDDNWHVRRNAAATLGAAGEYGAAMLAREGSSIARAALQGRRS
jgi:HEAT repeat protein